MKWYNKLIAGLCALAGSILPTAYFVQNKINKDVPIYVESHLEEIMKEQEEVLGIKHFGVPKISFESAPSTEGMDFFKSIYIKGEYIPKEDKMYLPIGFSITPEKNFTNLLARYLSLGCASNVKLTLDHELGHFYMDKLNESLGKGDWSSYPPFVSGFQNILGDALGRKLISEGIAVYFERKMNKDFVERPPIYEAGFYLVEPIIDEHGKKGIEYLTMNPPCNSELLNLEEYKEKTMSFLKN